jgi:hypothetical protein
MDTKFYRCRQITGTRDEPGPVPISKALWYRWVKDGLAPAPIKIGRASLWLAADVEEFARLLSERGGAR